MKSLEERMAQVEARLEQIERLLPSMPAMGMSKPATPAAQQSQAATPPAHTPPPARISDPSFVTPSHALPVTQILGWTGATALVLAAAYLIRLALDAGWLTPERQLGLAVLSGFSLIGMGLWLRTSDRQYASLLPAGGLVVLFLSIYGAHLYYHFIGVPVAAGAVILTCLAALWLGRLFESELYALFAVVGSYSAPFLLHTLAGSVTDLAIYFSAWSVLFCLYSIWIGHRRTYLLAAYIALLGFHYLWKQMSPDEWEAAFAFQTVQFLVFLGGTIGFSLRHRQPMRPDEAAAHLPLLLIFYALQYSLLEWHLPALAPWIALGSAAMLLLAYLFAKKMLALPMQSGAMLVGAYASLALFHAGYMELLPDESTPWVALLLPAMGIYFYARGQSASTGWPIKLLMAVIFAINYLRVIFNMDIDAVPGHQLLALLFAAELYVAYALARRLPALEALSAPALYVGHIAMMSAAVQIFDGQLVISLAWGVVALACLGLAFKYGDKTLGKSSLLIFTASAAKVMLYDLASATPLVRVGLLVVLGVTLYAGGWMYRKIELIEAK